MTILEKIISFKEPAKKVLTWIKNHRDLIYIILLLFFGFIISKQCSKIDGLGGEISRQENNTLALKEEIVNYKDELDRSNAEKHAYQLTQDELRDSIGLLKRKNYEYVSYINTNLNVRDTVFIETIIIREPDSKTDKGAIVFSKRDTVGHSSRSINVNIPYEVTDNKLSTGNASLALEQNIFVEGWLERYNKTNETFIHLRSDYPGLTFNSGLGIIAESSQEYERSLRKNCGIGLSFGPNVGLSYDFANQKVIPTVGIGVTIGFNYTPKWLQW